MIRPTYFSTLSILNEKQKDLDCDIFTFLYRFFQNLLICISTIFLFTFHKSHICGFVYLCCNPDRYIKVPEVRFILKSENKFLMILKLLLLLPCSCPEPLHFQHTGPSVKTYDISWSLSKVHLHK